MTAEEITEAIGANGYVVVHAVGNEAAFDGLAMTLGKVIVRTCVRLRPGVSTYLCQPKAVPFHTDHPAARTVAWWCEQQDEDDGSLLLIDSWQLLAGLSPDVLDGLRRAELPCPQVRELSDGAVARRRLLETEGGRRAVYFAEWLKPVGSPAVIAAWRAFHASVAAATARAIRLQPGDALFIDNHRVLHGRGVLPAASRRVLRRVWF